MYNDKPFVLRFKCKPCDNIYLCGNIFIDQIQLKKISCGKQMIYKTL